MGCECAGSFACINTAGERCRSGIGDGGGGGGGVGWLVGSKYLERLLN